MRALVLGAILLWAGCAATIARPRTPILVESRHWQEVKVYTLCNSQQQRLGNVGGLRVARFHLPHRCERASIRFVLVPLAQSLVDTRTFATHPIQLGYNSYIRLDIGVQLDHSMAYTVPLDDA